MGVLKGARVPFMSVMATLRRAGHQRPTLLKPESDMERWVNCGLTTKAQQLLTPILHDPLAKLNLPMIPP